MPNYRRNRVEGGTYFFTVTLQNRSSHLLIDQIDLLRNSVRKVKQKYPFHIDGWVVLPDHFHAIWTLPEGDYDYSGRLREIKKYFVKSLPATENRTAINIARGERAIWAKRFWEHTIRSDVDYENHMDYVFINPVKHGLVTRVIDWPYSSFHRAVAEGIYPVDWVGESLDIIVGE